MSNPKPEAAEDNYSWIPSADQSNPHEVKWDPTGVTRHMRHMQNNTLSRINEVVQNALDANQKGETNKVTVELGQKKGDIPLVVTDWGRGGIMRFHNGQIMQFIEAAKAISTKTGKERKGIGMSQYIEIAPYCIIITRSKDFMHRFCVIPHPDNRELIAFTNLQNIPMTEENFIKYNLPVCGTRVEFHNKGDEPLNITEAQLRKHLSGKWGFRLYDERDHVKIVLHNNKTVPIPDYILKNPPKWICTLKGGHKVYGASWPDPEGYGNTTLSVYGYAVESGAFMGPRQCKAYFNCDILKTNPPRNQLERNAIFDHFLDYIAVEARKYQQIATPQGERSEMLKRFIKEHAIKSLAKLLPMLSLPKKDPKNQNEHGQREIILGQQVASSGELVGYNVHEEPDPDRVIVPRNTTDRDLTNQTTANAAEGGDQKIVAKKKTKKDKKVELDNLLNVSSAKWTKDRPLLIIEQIRVDSVPVLYINIDNDELPILLTPHLRDIMLGQWLSELKKWLETKNTDNPQMEEAERMMYSRMRVAEWESFNIFKRVGADQKRAAFEKEIIASV